MKQWPGEETHFAWEGKTNVKEEFKTKSTNRRDGQRWGHRRITCSIDEKKSLKDIPLCYKRRQAMAQYTSQSTFQTSSQRR